MAVSRGRVVTGRVVDPDGRAVPWALVGHATTDAEGRFRLEGLNPRQALDCVVHDPQRPWRPS
jgi:protocatechuate 3,4-dioxygenase beta subunit